MSAVVPAASGPDLAPFKPAGWSGAIVLSNTPGTTLDSAAFKATDPIYIDFAVGNLGDAPSGSFSATLLIDQVIVGTFQSDGVAPPTAVDTSFQVLDKQVGPLSSGQHTVTVQIDPANAVAESDETNNTIEKTFNVGQSVNAPPTIGALSVSPEPVGQGTPIVLTAVDVADAEGGVSAVRFYRETNNVLGLQTGAEGDQLLATDFSSPYSSTVDTSSLPFGAYTYYAQVTDIQGLRSSVAQADSTVRPANLSATPGSPNLQPESDTGTQSDDNLTRLNNLSPASALSFLVPNTIAGSTIRLFSEGEQIGAAVATGTSTVVTTAGDFALGDGPHDIFATQTESGKIASGASSVARIVIDTTGPTLAALRVRGTAWSNSFLNYLSDAGLGQGGFNLPAGQQQSTPLPWVNINQVGFSLNGADAGAIAANALTVTGVRVADYGATATDSPALFTLSMPLVADRVTIHLSSSGITDAAGNPLDGEFDGAFPSGDGESGGDLSFTFNVLPGDANQSAGAVNASDLVQVRNRVGRTTQSPGTGPTAYSPFTDLDASGSINATDLVLVRNRVGSSLPTIDLFGSSRIRPSAADEVAALLL